MSEQQNWDIEADVVVLGSGGAAMTAAIAAHDFGASEVVILERSGMVGGTTAMSGGMLWIPNNHHMHEEGIEDSDEEVVTYLDSLAPGALDPETLWSFMQNGPEMLRYLAERTPVRLRAFKDFPDYQPYSPGAKPDGGRSLDNEAFSFERLGKWAGRVNPSKMAYPLRGSLMEAISGSLDEATLAEREAGDYRGLGQALAGALFMAVLDRNIPVEFEKRARKLVKDGDRVIGVIADDANGKPFRVRARRGVVIATGGFEWNETLVKAFVRGPLTGPVSVPENEGDGLLMAIEAGAQLGNMQNAFWMQSVLEFKPQHRNAKPNYLLGSDERARPGAILVNRAGKRFVNEAANYNALGKSLHAFDAGTHTYANLPYWLIIDQRYKDKYHTFNSPPGGPTPSFMMKADTLEELAEVAGIDPQGLVATVARFNDMVRKGHDDDFNRGDNSYDNFYMWGDTDFDPPYRTLGVIDQGPFYAVKMEAGALGTAGGPRTNADAQVVDWNGNPIPGLYAAGNAMAAVLGEIYGGAGGTLGPGLTFGYVAGRHLGSHISNH
ncbi:fumarate reductase/succinate dehydrogenase flavoprotein-like protein [Novosphingobium aromaticivorans DSM 12444]|uniref:Fumarate reductase/succinate dehydrogenase flavoprotein-like protein n=1 Tax=Novosphingobium aromaticivorans (strain ATCC 700278 / DSM 12444 / CCUG 56034 / CIP 105152 / NBRC 16084 / F199) TaxID=279238 RepID=Q2G803_NOVAD|nr:FAD-dependent oxidoreductase [Novosphingobium aromaticivorans]ABD26020.1 fumarate reductase/succinate dehydrogenase flavoprotein-like protein [Novosphingobium aromaticivorans DSM 12444]SCY61390.1 FAD binding domain-containing protein [Novosphingobium aromaticivorans]